MDALTKSLIIDAQKGNKGAFDTLIDKNNGLIWSIVKRYFNHNLETEDLYQIGCIGFIKAVERFDMSYNTEFSTYAVPMIMGEIKRFLRDDGVIKISRSIKENAYKIEKIKQELEKQLGRAPKISEIAIKTGLSTEEIAACETATLPVTSLQQKTSETGVTIEDFLGNENMEENIVENIDLKHSIKQLDSTQQQVIALRYFRGFTQNKIAEILGISQVQVSRLEKKALLHLRELVK